MAQTKTKYTGVYKDEKGNFFYYKCQNKSVNKFQDKNVQKIYNIDILKKGDIYDIRHKNTN